MRLGRSTNPFISTRVLEKFEYDATAEPMTVRGSVNKSILLFLLIVLTASITWKLTLENPQSSLTGNLTWVGLIGGLILAVTTIIKKEWAKFTAPAYALFEGLFLGAVSALVNRYMPGIVIIAVGLTFGILFAMLIIYRTGIIKVDSRFVKGVVAATGGVLIFYIINMILGFFGSGVSVFQMGWLGIVIQLVIIVIAALNLVLDFHFIEQGSESGLPKFMEWYAAFGLMVTLIWLYLEILRLLLIFASRD